MSSIRSLTNFYGSFFSGCAELSIAPYLFTLNRCKGVTRNRGDDFILGVAACVFFSTVVPILPELTSITMAIALFAALLALATMFVSYPVALCLDAMDSLNTSNHLARI